MLESGYYTSIANIGNILRERAKLCSLNDYEECDKLFAQAIEKFK